MANLEKKRLAANVLINNYHFCKDIVIIKALVEQKKAPEKSEA